MPHGIFKFPASTKITIIHYFIKMFLTFTQKDVIARGI